MGKTSEELEWARASKVGAKKSRIAALRVGVALSAAAALGFGAFYLLAIHYAAQSVEPTVRGERYGLQFIIIPSIVGSASFLAVFYAIGGRLKAEHLAALREFFGKSKLRGNGIDKSRPAQISLSVIEITDHNLRDSLWSDGA